MFLRLAFPLVLAVPPYQRGMVVAGFVLALSILGFGLWLAWGLGLALQTLRPQLPCLWLLGILIFYNIKYVHCV